MMTTTQYIQQLEKHGFTFRRLWSLSQPRRPASNPAGAIHVSGWAVYGPQGHLLGSLMICEDDNGLTVAETWETVSLAKDVSRLKALDLAARARVARENNPS